MHTTEGITLAATCEGTMSRSYPEMLTVPPAVPDDPALRYVQKRRIYDHACVYQRGKKEPLPPADEDYQDYGDQK